MRNIQFQKAELQEKAVFLLNVLESRFSSKIYQFCEICCLRWSACGQKEEYFNFISGNFIKFL